MLKTIIIFVIWVTIMFILTNFAMELISAASLFQNIMGILLLSGAWVLSVKLVLMFLQKIQKKSNEKWHKLPLK